MCWLSRTELSQTKDTQLNVDAISWVANAKSEEEWMPQRSVSSLFHLPILYQETWWRMSSCPSCSEDGLLHSDSPETLHPPPIWVKYDYPVVFLSLFWPFLLNYRYYRDLCRPRETTPSCPQHACSPHRLWPEWLVRTGYRCAALRLGGKNGREARIWVWSACMILYKEVARNRVTGVKPRLLRLKSRKPAEDCRGKGRAGWLSHGG